MRNKMSNVIQGIERLHQDIIVLTETKKKGSYIHFFSGVEKHKRGQRVISIMIKKKSTADEGRSAG